MTGQYLRVTATHTAGEGSGKTADATAANTVTCMPVDACLEFLAGGLMGPVTQMARLGQRLRLRSQERKLRLVTTPLSRTGGGRWK